MFFDRARTNVEWVAQVSILRPGCSGLKIGCWGRTADRSTALLRSSGRDDKERVVAYLKSCDWDVWIQARDLRFSGPFLENVFRQSVAQWRDLQSFPVRPGPICWRNPGLKSETWATHLKSGAYRNSVSKNTVVDSIVRLAKEQACPSFALTSSKAKRRNTEFRLA
jgi:hypothetical protein